MTRRIRSAGRRTSFEASTGHTRATKASARLVLFLAVLLAGQDVMADPVGAISVSVTPNTVAAGSTNTLQVNVTMTGAGHAHPPSGCNSAPSPANRGVRRRV